MLAWPWALLVDVLVLAGWSVAVGWWAARRPLERLTGEGWLLRLRPWEAGGNWYERHLRVRRWKDWLPEAGTWFGGLSKRRLPERSKGGLARFRAECVRAELTHWLAMAALPVFFVWSPWWLASCLLVGGLVVNGPCVVVPRWNRARIDGRRRERARPAGAGQVATADR
jgi:glycosyl-4,4'-diaponeurosporenoate acyltransferase